MSERTYTRKDGTTYNPEDNAVVTFTRAEQRMMKEFKPAEYMVWKYLESSMKHIEIDGQTAHEAVCSLTVLENGTGLTRDTVNNALKGLKAKGRIVALEKTASGMRYRLNTESLVTTYGRDIKGKVEESRVARKHPAVEVYKKITTLNLKSEDAITIANRVGKDDASLELWLATVRCVVGTGNWNPTNIEVMLEIYDRGGPDSEAQIQAGIKHKRQMAAQQRVKNEQPLDTNVSKPDYSRGGERSTSISTGRQEAWDQGENGLDVIEDMEREEKRQQARRPGLIQKPSAQRGNVERSASSAHI